MINRFLIADDVHFHNRGFEALLNVLHNKESYVFQNKARREMMTAFGDYGKFWSTIQPDYEILQGLSKEQLFSEKHNQVNLFEVSKAEILSNLLPSYSQTVQQIPSEKANLFDLIFERNSKLLLENMAAARSWLVFWESLLANNPLFSHAFVFSGSLIYSRTLLEILKSRPTRAFVTEHLFTGKNYYLEERYSPIANNSILKFPTYYKSLLSRNKNFYDYSRNKSKGINHFLMRQNKNVIQPEPDHSLQEIVARSRKTVLVIGQVINDFSIIESSLDNLNSVTIYKEVISHILSETDATVIFKGHPWERTKLGNAITLDALVAFRNGLGPKHQERLTLLEDFNIDTLIGDVDFLVTISSQGALEAAYLGLKPIVLGSPFYGGKGFTLDLTETSELTKFISTHRNGTLSLEEYKSFEEFLVAALEFHSAGNTKMGEKKIREILFGTDSLQPIPRWNPANKQQKKSNKVAVVNEVVAKKHQHKIFRRSYNKVKRIAKFLINEFK